MIQIPKMVALLLSALALGLNPAAGSSAEYPTKPVTLVVPYPAGGVVDIVGRLLADKLSTSLGQRVIVDNRVGAGGTIGAASAARADPDGYTILMGGSATHVFAQSLYKDLQYDPIKSFAPITQLTSGPLVLVVNPQSSARDMKSFLAYLRANGSRVNYASNGNGTFPHLAVELLKQSADVNPTHIPYSGGPKAILALLSGEVDFSINHIPNVATLIRTGKLRALATTGSHRSQAFPDLPTFDEAGFPGFETSAWFGLFVPAGTPRPVIDTLWHQTVAALKQPDLRAKLLAQGDEPVGNSPQEFTTFLETQLKKWPKIIHDAGIKVQ